MCAQMVMTSQVQAAAKEMVIDEIEIEHRKKLVGITSEDISRVRVIQNIVTTNADEISSNFFDYLSKFPAAKSLFTSSSILNEAKRLKKEHLFAMATGEYGQAYVEQRLKLGRLYSKVGLEPKLFFGAFQMLLHDIGDRIFGQFEGSPKDAFQNYLSLKKVAFFDLAIIVDVIVFDRERTIRHQQEAIRELSTPVLQLRERLLMLPIVGMIDTYRARLLTENLLQAIRINRAKVIVVDITGVAAVDSKVANHLIQAVLACRLMGAKVIITGLSAEIAQTLVTLGAELSKLNTVGDLQGGIEEAERLLGYKVTRGQEITEPLQ